jgi:hypothetical protein
VTLSDPRFSAFVNANFVPAWQSARPVPRVTIDFGEGRVLKRTLTGNTILEVRLPDGRVVDAFPGVYTPEDLLPHLERSLALAERVIDLPASEAQAEIAQWHRSEFLSAAQTPRRRELTLSKALVESPLLRALRLKPEEIPSADVLEGEFGRGHALNPTFLTEPAAALAATTRLLEDLSKKPDSVAQIRRRLLDLPADRQPTAEQIGAMGVRLDSRTNLNWARPAVHLLFLTYQAPAAGLRVRDDVFEQVLHVSLKDPFLGLADAAVPGSPTPR